MKITEIVLTPVAFRDPPLLNAAGVHEPWALRTIVEVHTDEGISGLGETYGDLGHLERLWSVVDSLVGLDVFALNEMHARVAAGLGGTVGLDKHGLTGNITAESTVAHHRPRLPTRPRDLAHPRPRGPRPTPPHRRPASPGRPGPGRNA